MKRRLASLLGALVLLTGAVMIGCKQQSSTPTYKITLNVSENGTVEVSPKLPKDGKVPQYTVLTFTAKPNADYETEWAGAAPDAGDKNKATLTVTANATVSVTFKKPGTAAPGGSGQTSETAGSFHVALGNVAHGRVQADSALPADGMVAKDTVLAFTATPDAGYEVDTWTGATKDSADNNKATLKVTAHTTVSVTFKEKTVDQSLLQISTGVLTGVKDKNALIGSLAIPSTVTKIGYNAFEGCSKLTSVTMPQTVTEIENNAFKGCSKLTNVTIGSDVTSIGQNAFQNCPSLTTITIPDKVTSIGNEAFQNCPSLTTITIPDKVTSIGNEVFKNCTSLTTLTIGKGVSSIPTGAFAGCSSLESITINSTSLNNIAWDAFKNCTELTSLTIGKSVANINFISSYSLSNINTVTVDPENPTYCSVDNTIYNKEKTKLIFALPSAVSGEFTIPDSVTEIDRAAFSGCHELTGITIGKNLTALDSHTFDSCSKLSSITVNPDNATYCSVNNIVYTKDKTKLIFALPRAVSGEFTIPNSVTEIGESAFANCHALSAVTIGARVTKIGNWAFAGCHKLTSIAIPDSVTEIGDNAFAKCGALSAVTLGNHVTKIGSEAFYECNKLTSIAIPDSVTKIGIYAFNKCEVLTRAVFKAPSGWKVLSKDGNITKNIDQADLEDTSKAATYLRDTYWDYTWQKQ